MCIADKYEHHVNRGRCEISEVLRGSKDFKFEIKSSATISSNDSKGHLSPLSCQQCCKHICSPKAQLYWDMRKGYKQTFQCPKHAVRLLAGNATLVFLLTVLLEHVSAGLGAPQWPQRG